MQENILRMVFLAVLRIRIRLNPFHFSQPDPNPVPGSKKSVKIMENFHKNNQNHENIIHFFKINELMFNGH